MFNSLLDGTFDIMEMIAPTAKPIDQLFQHIEERKQNLAIEMLDNIEIELDLGTYTSKSYIHHPLHPSSF